MLTSNGCHFVNELPSDHEEADTRMLLHAQRASHSYENVVIHSPDTDVFFIALSCVDIIPSRLLFHTAKKNKRRLIDLKKVALEANSSLNKTSCEMQQFLDALIGYHCFTGCDTTSCFLGRGKVKPLHIMSNNKTYLECFASLGSTDNVSENTFHVLEEFVCEMYVKQTKKNKRTVDELRYIIFCQKGGRISYDLLPPCRNTLQQHVRRSNYRAHV